MHCFRKTPQMSRKRASKRRNPKAWSGRRSRKGDPKKRSRRSPKSRTYRSGASGTSGAARLHYTPREDSPWRSRGECKVSLMDIMRCDDFKKDRDEHRKTWTNAYTPTSQLGAYLKIMLWMHPQRERMVRSNGRGGIDFITNSRNRDRRDMKEYRTEFYDILTRAGLSSAVTPSTVDDNPVNRKSIIDILEVFRKKEGEVDRNTWNASTIGAGNPTNPDEKEILLPLYDEMATKVGSNFYLLRKYYYEPLFTYILMSEERKQDAKNFLTCDSRKRSREELDVAETLASMPMTE